MHLQYETFGFIIIIINIKQVRYLTFLDVNIASITAPL